MRANVHVKRLGAGLMFFGSFGAWAGFTWFFPRVGWCIFLGLLLLVMRYAFGLEWL